MPFLYHKCSLTSLGLWGGKNKKQRRSRRAPSATGGAFQNKRRLAATVSFSGGIENVYGFTSFDLDNGISVYV